MYLPPLPEGLPEYRGPQWSFLQSESGGVKQDIAVLDEVNFGRCTYLTDRSPDVYSL